MDINLLCCDTADMLRAMPDGSADFIHADPPWTYDNGTIRGGAWLQYDGLSLSVIRGHLEATYSLVGNNAYLLCWCTFPLLAEWMVESAKITNWQYVTGGVWGKHNGLGVGIHVRGDAELWLLYKKGSPRPRTTQSNLIFDRRIGHSEKPQLALRALIEMACPPDGLVLDLYAGASASCMRACRVLGRRYLGAEIDPARHAEALRRYALEEQASMFEWQEAV